jgi:hypothetical protein
MNYICYETCGGGLANRVIEHCQVKIFSDLLEKDLFRQEIRRNRFFKDSKYRELGDIYENDFFYSDKKANFSLGGNPFYLSHRVGLLRDLKIEISKEDYKLAFLKNVQNLMFKKEIRDKASELIFKKNIELDNTIGIHIRTEDYHRVGDNRSKKYQHYINGSPLIDIMSHRLFGTPKIIKTLEEKKDLYSKCIDHIIKSIRSALKTKNVGKIYLVGKDYCNYWPILPVITKNLSKHFDVIANDDCEYLRDSEDWLVDIEVLSKCRYFAGSNGCSSWSHLVSWLSRKDLIKIFDFSKGHSNFEYHIDRIR